MDGVFLFYSVLFWNENEFYRDPFGRHDRDLYSGNSTLMGFFKHTRL